MVKKAKWKLIFNGINMFILLNINIKGNNKHVGIVSDNVTVFHRSFVTATDWAPSIWGALEFLSSRPNVTILILMQVTSPFILPSQLRSAFNKIASPVPFDCVFSVTR